MIRAAVLALILTFLLPAASRAETRRFDFDVLRNGRPIGSHVAVVDKREGEPCVLRQAQHEVFIFVALRKDLMLSLSKHAQPLIQDPCRLLTKAPIA